MDLSCPENNVILTKTESLTMGKPSAPKFARNKNILVIGGSGSGKTRFFVKPNLMQMHSSYVVTDPKGTVLVECGKMLERGRPKRVNGKVVYRRDDKGNYLKDKNGRYIPVYEPYKIKVFNTIDFAKSMHYNPFAYISKKNREKDILKFVEVLIKNTSSSQQPSGDDFWVKAEKLLYTAYIALIFAMYPEDEWNFETLIDMINNSECREDDEEFKNSIDLEFEIVECWLNGTKHDDPDVMEDYADLFETKPDAEQRRMGAFALKQFKAYKLAAGKTAKSIRTYNEGILGYTQHPFNQPEYKERAQRMLDIFVPFLEAHSELTAEEQRIFDDFKAQHPIRTYDDVEKAQGTFKIYQLPGGEKYHGIRFESIDRLKADGVQLNKDDYELMYEGEVGEFRGNATLEALFAQFNNDRPDDFSGHSLSVSDVIVISVDGKDTAYFCDSFGFTEMPEFFREKELVQEKPETAKVSDLAVGDVIMYDGARREVEKISDKSISLKDLDAPDYGGILLGTSDVLAYDGWQQDMEEKGFEILSKAEKPAPVVDAPEQAEPEDKGPVSLRMIRLSSLKSLIFSQSGLSCRRRLWNTLTRHLKL